MCLLLAFRPLLQLICAELSRARGQRNRVFRRNAARNAFGNIIPQALVTVKRPLVGVPVKVLRLESQILPARGG